MIIDKTEEFIHKAKSIHGDRYNYDDVVYEKSNMKIIIQCKIHGFFTQTPNQHLSGYNCAECSGNRILTSSSFIERSKKVHNNFYDYSKVKYKNNISKVIITCTKHGDYEQQPQHHLNGNGCSKCSVDNSRDNISNFIKKANKVHFYKYDYTQSKYVSARVKIKIMCNFHGEFLQTPNSHLNGSGCPTCSKNGYKQNKKGIFYVFAVYTSTNNILCYKFGITNTSIDKRKYYHEYVNKLTYQYVFSAEFLDGEIPLKMENYVKSNIKTRYVSKKVIPNGHTETISINDLNKLETLIVDFLLT